MKSIRETVAFVAKRFEYVSDPKRIFDPWSVMKDQGGVMRGDCDDFTTTCLYRHYGFWRFILFVCILHTGKIYRVTAATGENHLVGCVDGLWFDNWSLEALPRREFFAKTGHKVKMRYLSPLFIPKLIAGLTHRKRSAK